MSEINAAFGLVQLKHMQHAINSRKKIDEFYRLHLRDVPGIRCLNSSGQISSNYSYFPILVEPDYPLTRDELYEKLKQNHIFSRRYFYPLISEFPMYRDLNSFKSENLSNSIKFSKKVLCLPIYPGISSADQMKIISLISESNY